MSLALSSSSSFPPKGKEESWNWPWPYIAHGRDVPRLADTAFAAASITHSVAVGLCYVYVITDASAVVNVYKTVASANVFGSATQKCIFFLFLKAVAFFFFSFYIFLFLQNKQSQGQPFFRASVGQIMIGTAASPCSSPTTKQKRIDQSTFPSFCLYLTWVVVQLSLFNREQTDTGRTKKGQRPVSALLTSSTMSTQSNLLKREKYSECCHSVLDCKSLPRQAFLFRQASLVVVPTPYQTFLQPDLS